MMILIDYIDTPVKCTILLFLTTGKNNYFSPEKSFTTEQSGRSWSLRRQWVSGLSLPSSLSFCSDFFLSEPAPATLPFFRRILRLRRIMKCEIKAISWCEYHQGKNTNKPLKFPSNNYFCNHPLDFHLKELPLGFRLRRLDFPWVSLGPLLDSDSVWRWEGFVNSVLHWSSTHHRPRQWVLTATDGFIVLVLQDETDLASIWWENYSVSTTGCFCVYHHFPRSCGGSDDWHCSGLLSSGWHRTIVWLLHPPVLSGRHPPPPHSTSPAGWPSLASGQTCRSPSWRRWSRSARPPRTAAERAGSLYCGGWRWPRPGSLPPRPPAGRLAASSRPEQPAGQRTWRPVTTGPTTPATK